MPYNPVTVCLQGITLQMNTANPLVGDAPGIVLKNYNVDKAMARWWCYKMMMLYNLSLCWDEQCCLWTSYYRYHGDGVHHLTCWCIQLQRSGGRRSFWMRSWRERREVSRGCFEQPLTDSVRQWMSVIVQSEHKPRLYPVIWATMFQWARPCVYHYYSAHGCAESASRWFRSCEKTLKIGRKHNIVIQWEQGLIYQATFASVTWGKHPEPFERAKLTLAVFWKAFTTSWPSFVYQGF